MAASLGDAVASVVAQQRLEKVGELCIAAAAGQMFAMRRILGGGFDPNSADYAGRTALHMARPQPARIKHHSTSFNTI